ncbi:autotransporter domain-containing protein [Hahella ganghwensis]|uniref:autotransporter domain-containing protein n=1 Tax=Hahella ganghwensis TaxID=286420 RepID=UPI00036E3DF3|nr:autotransporter domain-containing protein [Hahella ganghwensis]
MMQQTSCSPRKFRDSFLLAAVLLVAFSFMISPETLAATGVPDKYTIDSTEGSETIVVTANDRLEVSTQEAIDYVSIVSVSSLSDSSAGTVQADPDDSFSINVNPSAGYSGVVTFTYRVRDIRGTSDDTTVTLNIVSSTSTLEAVDDTYVTGGDAISLFPAENDIRPSSGVNIEILSQPDSGTLSEAGVTGLYTYTPPADISGGGTTSFDYRLVQDGGSTSGSATVTIQLEPSLDPIGNGGDDSAQDSLAGVLQSACDANDNASFGSTNSELSQTCSILRGLSGSELDAALEEILLRQIGAQANSMKGIAAGQIKTIGARLQELRTGIPGVSLSGLQAQINGENVHLGDLVNGYLQGGSAGEEGSPGRLGGFITGTLSYGDGESRNRENSFDVDGQEILAGVDYRFTNKLVMGTALGYNTSETKEDGGGTELDVDGWNLSFYGNYYPNQNWYIDWLLGYGQSSIDTRRTISFGGISTNASGDTDGDSLSGALGTGYTHAYQSWTFDAYTNFEYRSGTVDGYRESNDAGLDLNIYETSTDTFTGRFGGRASNAISLDFGVLIPQFELELVKDFKNEAPIIEAELALLPQAGTFTLINEEPDDTYVNAGLSVTGVFKNGTSGFVRYGTMLSKDDVSFDTWQLGARMEFGGPSQELNLFQTMENQGVGAGAFVGTTGVGVALTFPLRNERLNFRTLASVLPYDTDKKLDDVEYDIDLDLMSLGFLLDWHPMDGGFRVSGGFFSLQHDISGSAKPTEDVEIGNSTFTPEEVGTLNAELDYSRSFAPYVGIGWGNAVKPDSTWSFSADLGVMFTDNPTVSLDADSPVADSNPALRAQLDSEIAVEEERINREDLEDIKYWPVLSVGVAYHF